MTHLKMFSTIIEEIKLFSLQTLNNRKQLFDYGETEIGNVSIPILKEHLIKKKTENVGERNAQFCSSFRYIYWRSYT